MNSIRFISVSEITFGAIELLIAAFLFLIVVTDGPQSDPHVFILSGCVVLWVAGMGSVTSGWLLLTASKPWQIVSQVLFVALLAFVLIEWFTSYAGWWEI